MFQADCHVPGRPLTALIQPNEDQIRIIVYTTCALHSHNYSTATKSAGGRSVRTLQESVSTARRQK